MFLDCNKVYYLSLFEEGIKTSAAGFLRLGQVEQRLCLEGKIQSKRPFEGIYDLSFINGENQGKLGGVRLQNGQGQIKMFVEEQLKQLPDCAGILFYLQIDQKNVIGTAYPILTDGTKSYADPVDESVTLQEKIIDLKEHTADVRCCDLEPAELRQPIDLAWEEFKKRFQVVYPFGDERDYVTLDLKDLHLLKEGESKLSHNSFLLHGYYNYRHLIVGKDRKVGNQNEMCHYLGVPGVFYEKEKMAAVMFGFEAFECSGPVTIGKYGYYLRQIEILE